MDNQSNNSEDEFSVYSERNTKPCNRNVFTHKGICVRSDFPGGNLHQASFQEEFRIDAKPALVIQFWGNSDAQADQTDKSWFYFTVTGIKDVRNIKYQQIVFKFKNANCYRKFTKQKKYRPYVIVRQQRQRAKNQIRAIFVTKMNILQDQVIQAQFVYKTQPGIDKASFCLNLPYNMSDLQKLNQSILDHIETLRKSRVYYHRQIIAQSIDEFPVYMFTITSADNISSYQQRQPTPWSFQGNRPYKLKSKAEIVITGRVHPSETSSSFCVQGIIQALIKNQNFDFLINAFIFRIVPITNPDGVQNGHYRLDNFLQNLNRFYGHSNPTKTPSILSVQKLIQNLRQKQKLFLFMDIHGHNSPKASFMFGNFSQNFYQTLQNKTFTKILESFSQGNFNSLQCQFSKKNMSIKQKYDEHSKKASARVFAYQGNSEDNNLGQPKTQILVEHSYTLEVLPYILSSNLRSSIIKNENSIKNISSSSSLIRKLENICLQEPTYEQIVTEYKKLGENVLISILQMIGTNSYRKLQQSQSSQVLRKRVIRQLSKFPEYYDRTKKSRQKQISKQLYQRYYQRWNILETYKQYISKFSQTSESVILNLKSCPIHEIYEQVYGKKNKQAMARKLKNVRIESRSKQKLESMSIVLQEQVAQNYGSTYEVNETQEKQIFEKQLHRRKLSKNDNAPKNKNSQMKSMQLQMLQKIQLQNLKQKQNRILNIYSIKNYTPTLSPQKLILKNQETSQAEKKIKKLIFRHKTQMQKQGSSKKQKLPYLYEIQFTEIEGQIYRKEKLKQFQQQYLNYNNQSIKQAQSAKKSNKKGITNWKIEQNKSNISQLNDKIIINWKNVKNMPEQPQKLKVMERLNPRIEELVKRISVNRQQKNIQSNNEQQQKARQNNKSSLSKIKQSKSILSNLLLSKSKNKYARKSQKEHEIIHSSSRKQLVYDNRSVLIPLIHQSKVYERIVTQSQNDIDMSDIPECFRNGKDSGISNYCNYNQYMDKKYKIKTNRNSNFEEQSLERSQSNIRFIQKAKQILGERLKIFKTIDQIS